jgi:hypothetical protein
MITDGKDTRYGVFTPLRPRSLTPNDYPMANGRRNCAVLENHERPVGDLKAKAAAQNLPFPR